MNRSLITIRPKGEKKNCNALHVPRSISRFFILLNLLFVLGLSSIQAEPAAPETTPATQAPVIDSTEIRQKFETISKRPQYAQLDDEDMNSNFQNWVSWALIQLNNRWSHFKYAKEMQSLSYMLNSLFIVVSFVALVTLFRRLIRRKPKTKRNRAFKLKPTQNLDGLAQLDLEIAEAEQARNWTAAFSASWRQFLLHLQIQKVLPADPSQTNSEYLLHLGQQGVHAQQTEAFKALVQSFDRTFYGQDRIDSETSWSPIKKSIQQTTVLFSTETGAPR